MLINVLSPPLDLHHSPAHPRVANSNIYKLPARISPTVSTAAVPHAEPLPPAADGGRWKPSIVGDSRGNC